MKAKYLFAASLPRSGTKLYTYALSVNPKILIAPNPNIELFRFLKKEYNKLIKTKNNFKNFETSYMLEDYYGNNNSKKLNLLKFILNSNLNIKFNDDFKQFRQKSFERSKLEIRDLSKYMKKISGSNYKDILKKQIQIINKRKKNPSEWQGFSESWIIEFFPAILRSFPNAKFLVNIRDPRAVIYANQNIPNKTRIAQILSYSRHFRKQIALTSYFLKSKMFKNKIHVFSYESLIYDPKKTIRKICNFLNVNFDKRSTDYKNIYDFQNKGKFDGDSTSLKKLFNFDKERTYHWKRKIDSNILKYIEFLCYHELKACGYKLFFNLENLIKENKKKIEKLFVNDLSRKVKWRSDSSNINDEIEFEFTRHSKNRIKDKKDIQKYFLTKEFYDLKLNKKKINISEQIKSYNSDLNYLKKIG